MKKYLFVLVAFMLPIASLAVELPNPIKAETPAELIHDILDWILGAVGAIATVYFIYGGFLVLTSAGVAERVDKGKKAMIYAVLGMIAIILSYSILQFFFSFFTSGGPS